MMQEEGVVTLASDEERDIYRWRKEQLERAGFEFPELGVVAERFDIDLHRACDIARKGGVTLALDILI